MIEVPYRTLGQRGFQMTVQKLANSTLKDAAAFKIKHITKGVREGFLAMREEYKKTIEDVYAMKVDGKVDAPAPGSKAADLELPFAVKEGMEGDAKGAFDTFDKKTLKLKFTKISADTILKCNDWTPLELEALECIVDEPAESA